MRRIESIRLGRSPNCSSLGNVVNVLVWTQAAVATLWVAAEAWEARRARREPGGGATLRSDNPPALIRTRGEHGSSAGDGLETGGPREAHVQVTRACSLPCPSCHIEPTADGEHVSVTTLSARFQTLSDAGVMHVAIGGGESLRHPDLAGIARAAHDAGLTIGMTTSGLGNLDDADVFEQVNVSLDGVGEGFQRARGYDGSGAALRAIRTLRQRADAGSGIRRVGINLVLDRATIESMEETVATAIEAGARDVQLLRLKPVGRAAAHYDQRRLTPRQVMTVWPRIQAMIGSFPEVDFRVDCSMVPWLAAHGVDPKRMREFSILGCHGGDDLVSVDVSGAVHPCSFVPEAVDVRWRDGVTAEPCASCSWRSLCRGGCHAVARHVTGELFAADPECPLVLRARNDDAPATM